jgi:hypothetical protein
MRRASAVRSSLRAVMKSYLVALGIGLPFAMLAFDRGERSALAEAIDAERTSYETHGGPHRPRAARARIGRSAPTASCRRG